MNLQKRSCFINGNGTNKEKQTIETFSGFAQPRVVGWEREGKPPVAQDLRQGKEGSLWAKTL